MVKGNYSNVVFYKIHHTDPKITDSFIGHTTNIHSAKWRHKDLVTNEKHKFYDAELYNFIRTHGGWSSFQFSLIGQRDLKSKEECLIRQARLREKHSAVLSDKQISITK